MLVPPLLPTTTEVLRRESLAKQETPLPQDDSAGRLPASGTWDSGHNTVKGSGRECPFHIETDILQTSDISDGVPL